MRIDRKNSPGHPVAACADLAQWNADDIAAEIRLACVHPGAGSIRDGDGTEGRLEILRKPQRDLARRRVHRAADPRLSRLQKRVRACSACNEQERQRAADEPARAHLRARITAENRFAQTVREQVVKVEVQLCQHAHSRAAGAIDGMIASRPT